MRTAGMILLTVALSLRAIVRFAGLPESGRVAALLVLYGIMLAAAIYFLERRPRFEATEEGLAGRRLWLPAVYLVVQSGLVVALLATEPHVDFFADLFIPPSLQAVFFFGRRAGLVWIAAFSLAMFPPMLTSPDGQVFAAVMTALHSGLCFMLWGYATQVQQAEARRSENQRLFAELQAAHRRLQGYATQVEELAAEQERGHLARELHDSVTQTAFSMNLTVQTAGLLLRRDPVRAGEQLQRLQELAASAMREIQALASQLRPQPAVEQGLAAALERLAAERLARDGLHVTVHVCGDGLLPGTVATGLYQIAQEALSNVARHAGTSQATLRLDTTDGATRLEIEDRGQGFDFRAVPDGRGHLGLVSMAERAREMGWVLSVEAQPGRGVRICVAPGGTP